MAISEPLKLIFLARTSQALLYRHPVFLTEQWVPSSVCPQIFKHGNERGSLHEVTIETWWLEQNPFSKRESEAQRSLFEE